MKTFDYHVVKDPQVFAQNRLPAHAELSIQYRGLPPVDVTDSGMDALSSIRFLCLDGVWKFAYSATTESLDVCMSLTSA